MFFICSVSFSSTFIDIYRQNCIIEGVGTVKIFHIFTTNLALDALEIQLDTESVAYHVNGCLTSVMGSVVTFTKRKQTVYLTGACSDFLAWASKRQAVNYTEYYGSLFTVQSMKVVECGGAGDSFYYSVLYLLRLHTPDFRLLSWPAFTQHSVPQTHLSSHMPVAVGAFQLGHCTDTATITGARLSWSMHFRIQNQDKHHHLKLMRSRQADEPSPTFFKSARIDTSKPYLTLFATVAAASKFKSL